MISFFVPGVPKPQGSKRGFVVKGRAVLAESAGAPLKDWRAVVAYAATEQMNGQPPFEGPIALDVTFYLPRPKSHPKTRVTWPVARPDCDKLGRSVGDALTHIVFKDDSQIVELRLAKRWAQPEAEKPVGAFIEASVIADVVQMPLRQAGAQ